MFVGEAASSLGRRAMAQISGGGGLGATIAGERPLPRTAVAGFRGKRQGKADQGHGALCSG